MTYSAEPCHVESFREATDNHEKMRGAMFITFRCPDCGKVTSIFQGNQLENMIFEHSLDLLAELEMDPMVGLSCDQGKPYIYFYNKQPSAQLLLQAVEKILEKLEA